MTTVLVAEPDAAIAGFVDSALRAEGIAVLTAADVDTAVAMVADRSPELALIGADLAGGGGLALVRRLRDGRVGAGLPVILLTAMAGSTATAEALAAGVDDYLVTPFDSLELVARVRATLRRSADLRAVSPLTALPGNYRITAEIRRRFAAGDGLAVGYVDLDNFKAFNDRYGWMRGDEVILLLAAALRLAATEAGAPRPFVGHVGGDDFVVVCRPAQVEALCATTLRRFDEGVVALHDPADAAQGYLMVVDRRGSDRRYPITSVSIGVATTGRRRYADYRDLVAVATEMKAVAKARPGSAVAVDRRTDPVTSVTADLRPGVHNGAERPARSGIGESPNRR